MDSAARTSFSPLEQRSIVKFLFLNNHNAAGIHRQLRKTLGTVAFSKSHVRGLVQKFRSGDFDVTDHRGGDTTDAAVLKERVAAITEAFEESRAWTMTSLSAKTEIPRTTCFRIVTEQLKMVKKMKKWIPHDLSPAQLEVRVVYSASNLRTFKQQQSRLEHTIAVDETWVSLNRPPERDQAREWLYEGESSTSLSLPSRFGPKVMIAMAMDIKGICYYEVLDAKEKMDAPRYLTFLKNLINRCCANRKHTVWLLDDNARPHRAAAISAWLEQNKISRWLHPPYSPDLSPCDFMCFHRLKRAIGGVTYPDIRSLKTAIDEEITYGNANGNYLAIRCLPERWKRCVDNKGEYL